MILLNERQDSIMDQRFLANDKSDLTIRHRFLGKIINLNEAQNLADLLKSLPSVKKPRISLI